ncbi:hypothetical protein QQX98_007321 [Neonectria punicea]|uniref:F-box domain-containing protein n=1 Tax=Neonectria punicea TaxID=979145 RepID=A0ABR1GYJ6_9HYPO
MPLADLPPELIQRIFGKLCPHCEETPQVPPASTLLHENPKLGHQVRIMKASMLRSCPSTYDISMSETRHKFAWHFLQGSLRPLREGDFMTNHAKLEGLTLNDVGDVGIQDLNT